MNSNMDLSKIKKYSHNMIILLNVFYWVAMVVAGASIITSIVIFFLPNSKFLLSENTLKHSGFSLDGILRFTFHEVPKETSLKNLYTTTLLMAAFISAFISIILKQLVTIMQSVEDKKPFDIKNSHRIFTIGIVLIICSFILPISEIYVAKAMVKALQIQHVTINYSINITLLITGLILFILSGIFRYGSYLQYEYDETV